MKKWWRIGMFDWDGTLFNSVDLNYGAVRAIFQEFHLVPPPKQEWREEMTADPYKFYYEREIPPTVPPEELDKIRRKYMREHWNEAQLNRGARELLLACIKERTLVTIVTSEESEAIYERLQELHISEYIDHVRPMAMQRGAALAETMGRFGCHSKEAFYVDDTATGILAAKKLGVTTIGFSGGFGLPGKIAEAEPDYPKDGRPITSLLRVMEIVLCGGEV